jgi:hypothetical protein
MRYLIVACLCLCALVVRPSLAQPPGGRPDVKKLESEVKKLKDQLKEKEGALEKARSSERKGPPFGFGPFGKGFDPAKAKEMKEKFEKMAKEGEKKGFGPFGKGFDPAKMKEMREKFEAMRKEMEKKDDKKGASERKGPPDRKGPPPFAKGKGKGFGPPARGFAPPAWSSPSVDIERRLDRIAAEIEAIRKDLKSKK